MSRHRNVRGMNYDEEYEGYFDVYGHSVPDDEYCISPSTAEQFLYRRDGESPAISNYMRSESDIKEEDENKDEALLPQSSPAAKLNQEDEIKLKSCLIELHNIVGETIPDVIMQEAIIRHGFDIEKSLDDILTQQATQQLKVQKPAIANRYELNSNPQTPDASKPDSLSSILSSNRSKNTNSLLDLLKSNTGTKKNVGGREKPKNSLADLIKVSQVPKETPKNLSLADMLKKSSDSNPKDQGKKSLADLLKSPKTSSVPNQSFSASVSSKNITTEVVAPPGGMLAQLLRGSTTVKSHCVQFKPSEVIKKQSLKMDLNFKPSMFGTILCLRSTKPKKGRFTFNDWMCYHGDVSINKFSFDEPSPDDIILEKQKLAFGDDLKLDCKST